MYVVKRDGAKQAVHFDKITERIDVLMDIEPPLNRQRVDPVLVAQKVIQGVYNGVETKQLDELAAETAAYMSTYHPDYSILAARIAVSNLHKQTPNTFSEAMELEYRCTNKKTHEWTPLLAESTYNAIMKHRQRLDEAIDHHMDYSLDYFGFKTLERSYLVKVNGRIVERPQYAKMRVAVGIHGEDIDKVLETYRLMSEGAFTHATPTLYNAGSPMPQMSSCFLLTMTEDSIGGIYDTLKRCALISKHAGGIGLSVSGVRATKSYIRSTNGSANGLVPMLRVFNDTARYVDQGGGKRKGSFSIYLEPWHADIVEFLQLKKNNGKEEERARDLFYALWINDLFMRRVKEDGEWSLFCPNEAPGLMDVYGEQFDRLYEKYECTAGLARRVMKARELWFEILGSQMETGTPYILYKDHANRKSNQRHLGTIRSSNLCCEIMEYTSPEEVAVCNLASIALPKFLRRDRQGRLHFDHHRLFYVVKVITRNLNRIIDVNYYPIPEARLSNLRHRPLAIGVQGLADVFILLRMPFDSPAARELNRDIFETIYFAACTASMELAITEGPYETYKGSPASEGQLQFDLWSVTPSSGRWDWASLKEQIRTHGLRNSLLVGPMPTASTSQILGNNECFEPYTSNLFTRRVLAGEFPVINRHLFNDLDQLGLWTQPVIQQIIADGGSVQQVAECPEEIKQLYRTVWEIPMRSIIEMAADRAPYIDQSQSMNLYVATPTYASMSSMHMFSWSKGLKTGMYYLRTKPAADPIKFTVDKAMLEAKREQDIVLRESQDRAKQSPPPAPQVEILMPAPAPVPQVEILFPSSSPPPSMFDEGSCSKEGGCGS